MINGSKIIDCFSFFNEKELLEIRLNTLDPVVDYFILVEATKTYTNKDKPLYFNEWKNDSEFQKFLPKIKHIVVATYPEFKDTETQKAEWVFENFQRRNIIRGLYELHLNPNDIILVSDLDEIPNPDKIEEIVEACKNSPEKRVALTQSLHYYYLNYKFPQEIITNSFHSKACTFSGLLSIGDPQVLRMIECEKHIPNAGWHFSFIGGTDQIIKKINAFAHQEYNSTQYTNKETLEQRIEEGTDLFDRAVPKHEIIPIDYDHLPKYVVDNKEKFKYMFKEVNTNEKNKQEKVTISKNVSRSITGLGRI